MKIVGGCISINAGRGVGSGVTGRVLFCGLILVDGKHHHWPEASCDSSPKSLGNVFGIGDKQPIAVDGADINADLVTKVLRASLVRPCRQMLLVS
jgi:hypothetical protein